jgi:branched-chain amino acid transport system substrate-binding protein
VAVGGGSVWAAANQEGVVWRIIPERSPVTRTIDVGGGVTLVAFGEGAVWTGNYVDGTVARIDPRTSEVTAKASVGAPQALAAGAGSAWVSVAGETTEGALDKTVCGEVASGAGTPDVLIASDLPLQGPGSSDPRAMEGAIRHVIERRAFRAGDYTVGYQSCDVSTPQTGGFEFRKCAANASAYAHAKQLVAVIGPWSSFCGQVQIPITNRAPGGPLAMVSAVSTHTGLTRGGRVNPAGGLRGEPAVYYPTGERSFVRLMAREALQGVANAMLAKELGLTRVYVLQDPVAKVEFADPFRRTARRLGIQIAGVANFSDDSKHDRLAERVARSGAQGVFIAGLGSVGGGRLVMALRERLGSRIKILAYDPFLPIAEVLAFAGPAAHGLYFSSTDVPPRAQPPAGRRFARDIGTFDSPVFGVLPAGQTAELILDAIARSDGTRASVLEELRGAKVEDGILGDFRIDRYGDITPARLAIFRITGATPPDAPVFPQYEGAVFDRVIEVPATLAGP